MRYSINEKQETGQLLLVCFVRLPSHESFGDCFSSSVQTFCSLVALLRTSVSAFMCFIHSLRGKTRCCGLHTLSSEHMFTFHSPSLCVVFTNYCSSLFLRPLHHHRLHAHPTLSTHSPYLPTVPFAICLTLDRTMSPGIKKCQVASKSQLIA